MGLEGLKVLVCDDSLLARRRMSDFLVTLGCEVYLTSNGLEALEVYKEKKPDFALLDIIMPVENGVDALKDIKTFDPDSKVVIISSVGNASYIKEAVDAGALDFLQKPVENDKLEKILLKHCKGANS